METKYHILVTLVFLLFFTQYACNKDNLLRAASHCIQEKIEAFKKNPKAIRIVRYKMDGGLAFLFDDGRIALDGSLPLLDMSCDTICSIGGFVPINPEMCSGQNFDNFFADRTVIWHR